MSRTKMSVLAVITMLSLLIGGIDTEAGHRRHRGARHHDRSMYGSHGGWNNGCCGGGYADYGSGGHSYFGTGYGSTGYGTVYNGRGAHHQNSGVVNYGGYGSGTSHGNAYSTSVCCY